MLGLLELKMSKSEQMLVVILGAQWRFGEAQTSLPATTAFQVTPILRLAVGSNNPAGLRMAKG